MLSTMQDGPLTIGQLVRYGTQIHGKKEVITWQSDALRTQEVRFLDIQLIYVHTDISCSL